MADYKITLENGTNKTELELRQSNESQWDLYSNNLTSGYSVKRCYSVKLYTDNDSNYYEVQKTDTQYNYIPLKKFEFETGGLNVSTNLLELLTFLTSLD